jgi:hypothetical protein
LLTLTLDLMCSTASVPWSDSAADPSVGISNSDENR